MPITKLVLYREEDGTVPVIGFLRQQPPKAVEKCIVGLSRLRELGHELRRPEADYLRDGVYELRIRFQSVNFRLLYFFHGQEAVVVSHGLTKEAEVPAREIDLAVERKAKYEKAPSRHTHGVSE